MNFYINKVSRDKPLLNSFHSPGPICSSLKMLKFNSSISKILHIWYLNTFWIATTINCELSPPVFYTRSKRIGRLWFYLWYVEKSLKQYSTQQTNCRKLRSFIVVKEMIMCSIKTEAMNSSVPVIRKRDQALLFSFSRTAPGFHSAAGAYLGCCLCLLRSYVVLTVFWARI